MSHDVTEKMDVCLFGDIPMFTILPPIVFIVTRRAIEDFSLRDNPSMSPAAYPIGRTLTPPPTWHGDNLDIYPRNCRN